MRQQKIGGGKKSVSERREDLCNGPRGQAAMQRQEGQESGMWSGKWEGIVSGSPGCIKWALRDWQRSSDPPHVINTALGSLITGTDLIVFTIQWTSGIKLSSCVFVNLGVCPYIIRYLGRSLFLVTSSIYCFLLFSQYFRLLDQLAVLF